MRLRSNASPQYRCHAHPTLTGRLTTHPINTAPAPSLCQKLGQIQSPPAIARIILADLKSTTARCRAIHTSHTVHSHQRVNDTVTAPARVVCLSGSQWGRWHPAPSFADPGSVPSSRRAGGCPSIGHRTLFFGFCFNLIFVPTRPMRCSCSTRATFCVVWCYRISSSDFVQERTF
jgi:hypothetical protein